MPLGAPSKLLLTLRGGSQRAGLRYALLGSLSGHDPHGMFGVKFDLLTESLMSVANTPLFPGCVGLLDPQGNAPAAFDLTQLPPLPQTLSGTRVSLAGFVLDVLTPFAGSVSNPVDLLLR